MSSLPIFATADAAILNSQNLIQPAEQGRRKISSSLMLSESSSTSDDSIDSGIDLTTTFTIPEYIDSVETLEYIGWEKEKAAEIWARWKIVEQIEREEATFQHDFLEYALSAIPYLQPEDRQENWDEEMLNWGIRAELRAAIMDEEYTIVRLTESAQYWVEDTMEMRYLSLERLQRKSQMRERAAAAAAASTNNTATSTNNAAASTNTASTTTNNAATSMNNDVNAWEITAFIPQLAASSTAPGSITLYKATTRDSVRRKRTGKISLDHLLSRTPSDFRGRGGFTLYFTPTLAIAKIYQGYIRGRHSGAASLILAMTVPNSLIEGIPPLVLRFGDLWKEIVYTSRRGYNLEGDLKQINRRPLIIAPIACCHNKSINGLDDYHQISFDRHVFHIGGSEGIQYVFQGEDMMDSLQEYAELRRVVETSMVAS